MSHARCTGLDTDPALQSDLRSEKVICIFSSPLTAVEFIERAHHERDQREKHFQALRREQEELNTAIAKCQENLPASGVPVTRQVYP